MPKECCEQYPSAGTRRALLRVLRAALQHAVNEDELVSRNVARQVKMPARDHFVPDARGKPAAAPRSPRR